MQNPMYNEHASQYAQAIKNNTFNAHYERPSLISLLPKLRGKSVLDLGCGSGEYLDFFLSKKCSHITAVDLSIAMVDIVKKRYGSSVLVYKQNLNNGIPKEKDSAYDLVVSSLAIHYIRNIFSLFKEVSRVLKKNGSFVFSTHHPFLDSAFSKTCRYFDTQKMTQNWNTIGKPVEVTFYRRPLSTILNSLTDAGLNIIRTSEGKPTKELRTISAEDYVRLTTRPFFLFIKCHKI